jgi:hypothetical protein
LETRSVTRSAIDVLERTAKVIVTLPQAVRGSPDPTWVE